MTIEYKLTIDVAPVRTWFDGFVQYGADPQILKKTLGLSREDLQDQDKRVPLLDYIKMCGKGVEMTSPDIALQAAHLATAEGMGLVGHVMKSSATFRESGMQLVRYSRLMCEMAYWEMEDVKDQYVAYRHHCSRPEFYSLFGIESSVAASIGVMRQLLGDPSFKPVEIHFQYSAPSYVAKYEEVFQCPLKFDQEETQICIPCESADLPISTAEPYVQGILLQHAEQLMKELEGDERLQDRVQRFIAEHLATGSLDIDLVSENMKMSRWTLTRKLKEEGSTFQALLKRTRKEIAIAYLQKPKISISEVAFLLGYSESSAFQRAFKNWSGKSPYEYRQSFLVNAS